MNDQTATQISQEQWQAARKLRENDARARMLADGTIAAVINDHGRIDPEHADREAFDIARKVAALLVQRIYEDDAELRALTMERDHYRDRLLDVVKMTPTSPILLRAGLPIK